MSQVCLGSLDPRQDLSATQDTELPFAKEYSDCHAGLLIFSHLMGKIIFIIYLSFSHLNGWTSSLIRCWRNCLVRWLLQIVPVCFIVGTLILQSDHKLEHSGDEGDVRRQSSELSKVAFCFINIYYHHFITARWHLMLLSYFISSDRSSYRIWFGM